MDDELLVLIGWSLIMDLARSLGGPAVCIGPNKLAILVKVSARAVGDADYLHPLSSVNRDLHIAANAQSARRVKQVKADPVCSRGTVQRVMMVIHPESPLLIPCSTRSFSFAKPVNISRVPFDGGEVQRIWPDPCSNRELPGSAGAIISDIRDLDVTVTPVEFEVNITSLQRSILDHGMLSCRLEQLYIPLFGSFFGAALAFMIPACSPVESIICRPV